MVVTRRQSAGPPAVTSRTSSSTGTPRSAKGKDVDKSPLKNSGIGPSNVPSNGISPRLPAGGPQVQDDKLDDAVPAVPAKSVPPPKATTPKSKAKSKSKRSSKGKRYHPNKGISAFDIIARLFLVWLTIYTLSVCPEDMQQRSPVCRALTEYRRLILEPYIYPPIRATLDHPSVAPHIERLQPYYNQVVQFSMPWVRRGKHEWRNSVIPRLHWLQIRARPYVRLVEQQYDVTIGPFVQQVSNAAAWGKVKAEPFLLTAALKTHQSWKTTKPFMVPIWREVQRIPGILRVYVGQPLGDARRQWVDPQLTKMWDAVVEQGRADTRGVRTSSPAAASQTRMRSTSTTGRSSSTPSASVSQSETSTSLPIFTASVDGVPESRSDEVPIPPSPVSEPKDKARSSVSSVVTDRAFASTSFSNLASTSSTMDVLQSTSDSPVPPFHDPTNEVTSSIIHESLSSPSFETPTLVPSGAGNISSPPQPSPPMDEDAVELENFLSDLLDEPEKPAPAPPVVHEETEAELAERLRLTAIETAEKRAEIEARHDQWEIDLEHFGRAQRQVVRAMLKNLRDAAAEEARSPGSAVRIHVEGLAQEAEKSLKSLKVYSNRLTMEDKTQSEKIKMWENVLSKVDKRFGEHVDAAADAVRDWWNDLVRKENQELGAIVEEVSDLAHRAQSDLGMDYAWLGDVSYEDWQRYHRLVDKSKLFTEVYLSMQNGSLPNAPPNPVLDIMEALQEEVDDMILGFEANLDRIKSSAIERFSTNDSKPDSGSTKTNDEAEPEVSILPIDPDEKSRPVPPVILSRRAEEVEAAASRAAEAQIRTAHVEL